MFNIDQVSNSKGLFDYEFYFTESPIGGEKTQSLLGTKSVKNGPLMLDINSEIPDYFYYQDRKHKYMGGLVVVHSQEE